MIIKSITTEYVTENPFAGIIDPDLDTWEPHYSCTIVSDIATSYGVGDTEYQAERDATAKLANTLAAQMHTAIAKYNVSVGAGNLEIA